jgi:hypothetical protein
MANASMVVATVMYFGLELPATQNGELHIKILCQFLFFMQYSLVYWNRYFWLFHATSCSIFCMEEERRRSQQQQQHENRLHSM